jgi:predicted TIM-barrel fold metal-dependent hydrolase
MEFLMDTTRTITNMVLKGTFKRYPDIKFVVPHAGAFLSLLADRLALFLELGGKFRPGTVAKTLGGLYYDLAGASVPRQLESLLSIVGHEHLLYGSDTPYTPELGCIVLADRLDKTELLSPGQREDVYRNNALRLFPGLGPAAGNDLPASARPARAP